MAAARKQRGAPHPLACRAALTFLDEMVRCDLGGRMVERGGAFRRALAPLIEEGKISIRGRGLLLGVSLPTPSQVLGAMRGLLERGYIVLPAGAPPSVLCLTPPCCITDEQIAGFASALRKVIEEVTP